MSCLCCCEIVRIDRGFLTRMGRSGSGKGMGRRSVVRKHCMHGASQSVRCLLRTEPRKVVCDTCVCKSHCRRFLHSRSFCRTFTISVHRNSIMNLNKHRYWQIHPMRQTSRYIKIHHRHSTLTHSVSHLDGPYT